MSRVPATWLGGPGFDSLCGILALKYILVKEIEGLESCNIHIQNGLVSRVLATWLGGPQFDSLCVIHTLTFL